MNDSNLRPFCPSWLDDMKLKPIPFRVFLHLCRRAGKDGKCYPSAPAIAGACLINRKTVWPALAELEKAGLVVKGKKGFGQSNTYTLTFPAMEKEAPIDNLQSSQMDTLLDTLQSSQMDTLQSSQMDTLQSSQMGHRKGNPSKGIQRRESNKGKTQEELALLPFGNDFSLAWQNWEQHREEIKKKITPTSRKLTLAKLEHLTEAEAIEAINRSISNGWQGIFPEMKTASQPRTTPLDTSKRPGEYEPV